jgi:hypothetical protein
MAATKKKATDWQIGKMYFIRTVTLYYVGRLIAIDAQDFTLDQCAWVADTGRFSEAMRTGKLNEVEPYPDGPVKVSRGGYIDACIWTGEAQRIVL